METFFNLACRSRCCSIIFIAQQSALFTPFGGSTQYARLGHTNGSSATLVRYVEEIFDSKPVLATNAAASRRRWVGRALQRFLQGAEPLFSANPPFRPPALSLFAD